MARRTRRTNHLRRSAQKERFLVDVFRAPDPPPVALVLAIQSPFVVHDKVPKNLNRVPLF